MKTDIGNSVWPPLYADIFGQPCIESPVATPICRQMDGQTDMASLTHIFLYMHLQQIMHNKE